MFFSKFLRFGLVVQKIIPRNGMECGMRKTHGMEMEKSEFIISPVVVPLTY